MSVMWIYNIYNECYVNLRYIQGVLCESTVYTISVIWIYGIYKECYVNIRYIQGVLFESTV